jgi:hypothetical protein
MVILPVLIGWMFPNVIQVLSLCGCFSIGISDILIAYIMMMELIPLKGTGYFRVSVSMWFFLVFGMLIAGGVAVIVK